MGRRDANDWRSMTTSRWNTVMNIGGEQYVRREEAEAAAGGSMTVGWALFFAVFFFGGGFVFGVAAYAAWVVVGGA